MMQTKNAVRRVLTITLILNVLVAMGKITIGIMSGALAITADGFHSLIDGMSNVVALIASVIAARPPDEDHPYGHHRYETLAALMIGAFLLFVAWEIITGALGRLGSDTSPTLSPLAFGVMAATLCVNIGVSSYQIHMGKKLRSELLLADAANTRADVFITLSVIVSMGVVALTGWAWVDLAAALVVVLLIGRAAWRILAQTGRVLADTAPYSASELARLVAELPIVAHVVRARSRGTVDDAHIDIDLCVAPAMTASQTAAITTAVRDQLAANLDGVREIEVHFIPDYHTYDPALVVTAVAQAHGLSAHEISMVYIGQQTILDLHVEVPAEQTLTQAHAVVTALEDDLQAKLPQIDDVVTHIEPARQIQAEPMQPLQTDDLQRRAYAVLRQAFPAVDWHNFQLYAQADGLALSLHAAIVEQMTIIEAHTLAEDAETLLRAKLPRLQRVTIHTEPYNHAV